ncbi:MAG TPA: polyprenyl synthetase family protein [Microbacteriaceae bacterium]|nr:polyprenyl synthetase family protein [Microbacteriaceae bacterium]
MHPLSGRDLAEHLDLVDEILEGMFTVSVERAGRRSVAFRELWEQLRRNAQGGKRIRPRLVLASYHALGGTDTRGAASAAAAFELLHTALVVHDDVIDRDFVRRGIPNVSGSYRDKAHTAGMALPIAEHRGMGAAVIAGDLALAGSYQLMRSASDDPAIAIRLQQLLDDAIFESAAGELIDLDFSIQPERIAPVEDILDMERLKTAVYSFEAPLQAGALLAGAGADVVAALGVFGTHIGIAYQVVDDVLGIYGDSETTGKPVIGDLREGKHTVVIGFAAQHAEWHDVKSGFGSPDLDEAGAARLRADLERIGARRQAEDIALWHADEARSVLNGPLIPADLRDHLVPLVVDAVERIK